MISSPDDLIWWQMSRLDEIGEKYPISRPVDVFLSSAIDEILEGRAVCYRALETAHLLRNEEASASIGGALASFLKILIEFGGEGTFPKAGLIVLAANYWENHREFIKIDVHSSPLRVTSTERTHREMDVRIDVLVE